MVNHHPQLLPMGGLGLIAQPFVVAFSVGLGILHNGPVSYTHLVEQDAEKEKDHGQR